MRCVLVTAKERGWDAEAILPEEASDRVWLSQLRDNDIPVRFMSGSRTALARRLGPVLDESSEPTLLHTHFTTYDLPAVAASARRPNVSVYWHVHTVLSNRTRAVLANAAKFSTAGRSVARILCPSLNIAQGVG